MPVSPAELSALISEGAWDTLKAAPRRVARLDVPVPFSPPLEEYIAPTTDKIVAAVRATIDQTAVA